MPVAQVVEVASTVQGEGTLAGRRQVLVRLAGCNLDCDYCDTPGAHGWARPAEIEVRAGALRFREAPNPMAPEAVAGEVLRLAREAPHHSVSWTGGEPLWSAEFLALAVPPLRAAGLAQSLQTNGTLPDELERVVGLFDHLSVDLKSPLHCRGVRGFEAVERFVRVARRRAKPGALKLVVTEATPDEEAALGARLALECGWPFVLQPVTPVGGVSGMPSSPPSARRLLELQAKALGVHAEVLVIPQLHVALGLR